MVRDETLKINLQLTEQRGSFAVPFVNMQKQVDVL